MGVLCHSCQQGFPDYEALAKHIASSKTGHRHGKKWAAGYLMKVRQLNGRKELHGRIPMTEEQKQSRLDMVRELSGEVTVQPTYCPHCHTNSRAVFPIEYGESKTAWRKDDRLVVLCNDCRRD